MKLNDLKPARGARKVRRRVGRGTGSGRGKTAGRGHKGQLSRSGVAQGAAWEGGRSHLVMRLPKRGFTRVKAPLQIVNVGDLERFDEGTVVTVDVLARAGLVRRIDEPVKLLGDGELTKALTIDVDAVSRGAAQAVASAGGSVKGAAAEESA